VVVARAARRGRARRARCLALAVGYRFRNEIVAPLLIDLLARRVESESGLVLTIDEVAGDWTHELRLSGVSLVARDEHPQCGA